MSASRSSRYLCGYSRTQRDEVQQGLETGGRGDGDLHRAARGYMRVSSVDQNLDRQSLAIGGCDKVFSDKASGKGVDGRQGLREALNFREGDLFVVASMDRSALLE